MKYITKTIADKFRLPNVFERFSGSKISDYVPVGEELIAIPMVNIADREGYYDISVALPGLEKKDVNIRVENGQLTISSEKIYENQNEYDDWVRQEYGFASFYRTFKIPDDANADKIKANMKNGVLKIKLPRLKGSQRKYKTIAVD